MSGLSELQGKVAVVTGGSPGSVGESRRSSSPTHPGFLPAVENRHQWITEAFEEGASARAAASIAALDRG
jgi:hypothetical protein